MNYRNTNLTGEQAALVPDCISRLATRVETIAKPAVDALFAMIAVTTGPNGRLVSEREERAGDEEYEDVW